MGEDFLSRPEPEGPVGPSSRPNARLERLLPRRRALNGEFDRADRDGNGSLWDAALSGREVPPLGSQMGRPSSSVPEVAWMGDRLWLGEAESD